MADRRFVLNTVVEAAVGVEPTCEEFHAPCIAILPRSPERDAAPMPVGAVPRSSIYLRQNLVPKYLF